jgi:HAD superfamily hydrolase (TIGR01459 family)
MLRVLLTSLVSFITFLPFHSTFSFQLPNTFVVTQSYSSASNLTPTFTTTLQAMSQQEETSPSLQSKTLHHIPNIQSLTDPKITKSYTTFLLDMWGVMHNGSKPYNGVINTIQELKKQNKKLIILSNSSKRLDNAIKMLNKLGFNPNDFDLIITSGDISHRMLSGDKTLKCQSWDVLDKLLSKREKKVFVFGSGDDDETYCTSSGWTLSSLENADLIIARGTFTINDGSGNIISKHENENEYWLGLEQSLEKASKRKVPMLITNPDKVRPDVGLPPMPGAIGDAYEKYLGLEDANRLIKRIGKPYPEVYELALNEFEDTSCAIMVGDALETDITGGKWSNIDSLWVVNDGIHAPFVNENHNDTYENNVKSVLDEFNDKKGYEGDDRLHPTHVTEHFKW